MHANGRGFCQVNFHFFDTNMSAINPKSKHYVTLATSRVVPVRRAKAFICRKSCPACQGYRPLVTLPAEVRQPELSRPPRRVRDPNGPQCKRLVYFGKKQAKCYLRQSISGAGLSRVPETISPGPELEFCLSTSFLRGVCSSECDKISRRRKIYISSHSLHTAAAPAVLAAVKN